MPDDPRNLAAKGPRVGEERSPMPARATPIVLAGVVLTMLTVGLLAAWIPAMRAPAAGPSILLREN